MGKQQTQVVRRTVELAGRFSVGVLRGQVQRAFASGGKVAFDGRRWTVERFETSKDPGQPVQWTALLVNEDRDL